MGLPLRTLAGLCLPLALPALALWLGRPAPLPPADFRFVLPKENTTLDPAHASSVSDGWLVQSVFDGLLRFDGETLEPRPAAATGYERSPDGLVYTFHVDPAGRWSDGRPVTAADFEYGWKRLLDPAVAGANGGLLSPIRNAKAALAGAAPLDTVGVAAADEHTLVVSLDGPCAYFPQLVCHFALMPARRDLVQQLGERAYAPGILVGNGAFRPVLRRVRDRLRLVRNENHPRAATIAFGIVDALAIDSKATALNLFLEGDVDWVNALPALAVPRLRERGSPELVFSTMLGTNFLRMNVKKPPFDDERVRRAIDFAIDRGALCRYVYRIGETPAAGLVCPGLPGYAVDESAAGSRDRVERARELLAEAGYPGGVGLPEIELLHAADEAARPVAEALAARLAQTLGVAVRPVPQEFKVFIDSQKNLRYDVCLGNWIGDYPDPSTFLDVFRSDSGNNRTGWQDAEYDRLVTAATSETDPPRRNRLLRDAEDHLLAHGPIAPIAWRGQANLVARDVFGFHANPLDQHPLDRLSRARE